MAATSRQIDNASVTVSEVSLFTVIPLANYIRGP